MSNRHNSTYIMSHGVWFKFSSEDESSLIAFSGPSIKVVDLKREISTRRKLGSDENFELRVKDANGREYRDTDVVKKHTYVIVQRVTKSVGPYRRPKAAVQRQSVGGADAKEKFVFGEDVFEPKTKIETVDNLTEESKESEKRYNIFYFSMCNTFLMHSISIPFYNNDSGLLIRTHTNQVIIVNFAVNQR